MGSFMLYFVICSFDSFEAPKFKFFLKCPYFELERTCSGVISRFLSFFIWFSDSTLKRFLDLHFCWFAIRNSYALGEILWLLFFFKSPANLNWKDYILGLASVFRGLRFYVLGNLIFLLRILKFEMLSSGLLYSCYIIWSKHTGRFILTLGVVSAIPSASVSDRLS